MHTMCQHKGRGVRIAPRCTIFIPVIKTRVQGVKFSEDAFLLLQILLSGVSPPGATSPPPPMGDSCDTISQLCATAQQTQFPGVQPPVLIMGQFFKS